MSKETIAVWGVGHIGMTTLFSLANEGYKGIAIDVNRDVVKKINSSTDFKALLDEYYCEAMELNPKEVSIYAYFPSDFILSDEVINIHYVCVPTEANGLPTMDIVFDTISNICKYEKNNINGKVATIVIESTLTPGTAEKIRQTLLSSITNKKVQFIVAPRRDWFEKNYNLCDIVRIYGADSQDSADYIEPFLRITTPTLRRASHYSISEIVKPVENAFRHLDIMLAQQLAMSYSDIDIREVLELAGTKWNINTYFPSIGIGGYCIPISSKYILAGNKTEDHLSLLKEVVGFEKEYTDLLCDIISNNGIKRMCILGASYRSNVLMLKGSHLSGIIKKLKEKNIEVFVVDPSFEENSIAQFFDTNAICLNDLGCIDYDGIIINNWHDSFDSIISEELKERIFDCKLVLDNTGELESYSIEKGFTNYRLIGRSNWKK